MPGVSGVTVVTMLVCSFYFACEAAGASCARHSLRPLIVQGQEFKAKTRARGAARSRSNACGSFPVPLEFEVNWQAAHLPTNAKVRRTAELFHFFALSWPAPNLMKRRKRPMSV